MQLLNYYKSKVIIVLIKIYYKLVAKTCENKKSDRIK